MVCRIVMVTLAWLGMVVFTSFPSQAKRLALVIGNDNYDSVSRLEKAANDATAVSGTLQDIGFQVHLATNLKRRDMSRFIFKFTEKIEDGDEVIFYYAGHGIALRGQNYILPTDVPSVRPGGEDFLITEAFSLNSIIYAIKGKGARVNLVILDACRNNPFPKQAGKYLGAAQGLVRTEPPTGTFILYSAGYEQLALDQLSENDPNPNSVYTRKLIPLLKQRGLSLTGMAKKLREDVEQLALVINHKQFPAYYDQLRGNYYLLPQGADQAALQKESANPDIKLWDMVRSSKRSSDYEFYLRQFPKGSFSAVAKLKIKELALLKRKKDLSRNINREKEREVQRREKKAESLSGIWRLSVISNNDDDICVSFSTTINISNGVIRGGRASGRLVGKNRVRITTRGFVSNYTLNGHISGGRGRGSFELAGGGSYCSGRFTMVKQ